MPFDIDDNPEDDTQSAYYKSESLLAVSSNDVGWIVGVAGLVLVVAWLLGAIQAPKPPTPKPSTGKGEARTNVNEEVQSTTAPEPIDDIQIQTVEDEAPSEPETSADEDMVIESTIEVIESVEETPNDTVAATASGRLASLREEIGSDGTPEREGSIEDRMKKFLATSDVEKQGLNPFERWARPWTSKRKPRRRRSSPSMRSTVNWLWRS